ncbi:uncharacterized protein LOC111872572 [Cryptotermes secundus]|uniref:uncharacterized protein LOC111872572 n=1 Tax=Cryptotermes secundus TaxID=105785 RepID=UPI000CD7D39A|nr:uncharacterized protein LOC111872572 [Cryptotermes secundus]XP_023722386.1 uncharacterized protein LOC111872572 [Cryptotermes secundus]XP_023722387.1 uncharacterized protein LOC111872572 [Cryptotermes secundus]
MGRKKCFAPECTSSSEETGMIFFNFPMDSARAMVWAGRVGLSCTTNSARMLHNKVLCNKHFSESDFTTAERVHINRCAASLNALVDIGGCSSEYMVTAVFVEEVDNLFSSFNGGTSVGRRKTLSCPLSDNSPHIELWKKASMGIKSWIFLKDGKPAFLHPPLAHNGWLIDITAAQHV